MRFFLVEIPLASITLHKIRMDNRVELAAAVGWEAKPFVKLDFIPTVVKGIWRVRMDSQEYDETRGKEGKYGS
ncbi:hypothetical protein [Brevibacillus massiliensis]|jgi:hypothetical protein|uniref:hypothetical protein n=1 Tax=Brevibacillus massiliensis TaxID=1118054 RepID=UPI00164E47C0|nr:hypothetical protein [Brevibacillus massiliensis]